MKITSINARSDGKNLRVVVHATDTDGSEVEAYLPARETAAFLPRELLTYNQYANPATLYSLMNELLEKLALGREIRVWNYKERLYCSFPRWRKSDIDKLSNEEASEPHTSGPHTFGLHATEPHISGLSASGPHKTTPGQSTPSLRGDGTAPPMHEDSESDGNV